MLLKKALSGLDRITGLCWVGEQVLVSPKALGTMQVAKLLMMVHRIGESKTKYLLGMAEIPRKASFADLSTLQSLKLAAALLNVPRGEVRDNRRNAAHDNRSSLLG